MIEVKLLEWVGDAEYAEASTPLGIEYQVAVFDDGQWGWYVYNAPDLLSRGLQKKFPSLAEAIEAAQEDYERRVLSCIRGFK